MQITPKDPLLAAARIVLIISMGVALAATAAFAIGFLAVSILRESIWDGFAASGAGPELLWIVLGALVLLTAASLLSFYFLRHLYRIVGTVGDGDPFVPVNAARISAMAWITLAVDLLLLGVAILAFWAPHDRYDHVDFNFGLAGLLLSLVLFVIARVFREGTRMREELEGTV